jgi:VCBS repeat-containing protein
VKLTTHLHIVTRSKNEWSYTSAPQYAFMAWYLIKHRGNFTFTLNTFTVSIQMMKIRNPVTYKMTLRGHWYTPKCINVFVTGKYDTLKSLFIIVRKDPYRAL